MLQGLAEECEKQGLKMKYLKTKVMVENDTLIYGNNIQLENVESYVYCDRDAAPKTKTKTSRFKEESRVDGQHSLSTATSSRITLKHA